MKVELRNIQKHFGPVHANDDINLEIPAGLIQGILGENGAGKSTLMKILSGFIQADSGEILLDGQPRKILSPADAIRLGVGMLHQDPLDFPPMKVIENFLVGQPGSLFVPYKAVRKGFLSFQEQFGFSLDPDAYIDTLTVGERQQLEILRLLWLGARVLILDEPTTGISAIQKERLFETLRLLASQGKTIIFVSHKLEDVEVLCHRAVVLQKGKLVGAVEPPYDIDKLVELMFGKAVKLGDRTPGTPGECVLELNNLCLEDHRLQIRDVNLKLCSGEVIGLAGMEGSGQGSLLRACAGILRPVSGTVTVKGKDMTGSPYPRFVDNRVAFLPASRMEEGLIPGLTLAEHFTLAEEKHGLLIDQERGLETARNRIQEFSIYGTPASRVEKLSGGNQQRALLALLKSPLNLLLLENPTRGLDIESSIYIWRKLKERCRQGTAILFISPDLEEVLQYSDRIIVFFSGRVSAPLDASSTTVERLGQLIGGKNWTETVSHEELQ
ncbi:MAG: ATP-binding cassette domain-containing protein [Chloroflexi bacterium]|nr:ATP-binding cassette domain-containing protein [Anaerolineaceae bacterium]NMB88510.1 ATP-binding cassette domain-containing protein [Chloroflexota bacterium]